jgi:diguanylate cyclase (GGDEF)-like protein
MMNGTYLWVEANLRVIRDPVTGAPSGILNMVRDISTRKRAEQELQAAYRAMEELAVVDALTGLANRRRFDTCLTSEWRRGMREREPLSLILLDVDHFKRFNDTFGHLRGDSCLKQVAESAMDVVTRPGDLVARFGGEEFAIILPNTDHTGALRVADEVRESLMRRNLQHPDAAPGVVTVSGGCATIVPGHGQRATELIEMADCALYRAKHLGRNRVCGNPDQALISDKMKPASVPLDAVKDSTNSVISRSGLAGD